MIGVYAQGRLGSRMFQLAFAYAAARRLNTTFFLNTLEGFDYFDLTPGLKQKNRIRKALTVWRGVSAMLCQVDNREYPPTHWLAKLKDGAMYAGLLQSAEYFQDCEKEIRALFHIKPSYVEAFQKLYGDLFRQRKIVAVHVRRTDFAGYLFQGVSVQLPMGYYMACLAQIHNLKDYQVVFVSDDVDFVRKYVQDELGEQAKDYVFANNAEIVDFQILLNADVCILSNSCFAWWAAYLNTRAQRVLAPRYWLGYQMKEEYPLGVMYPKWEWTEEHLDLDEDEEADEDDEELYEAPELTEIEAEIDEDAVLMPDEQPAIETVEPAPAETVVEIVAETTAEIVVETTAEVVGETEENHIENPVETPVDSAPVEELPVSTEAPEPTKESLSQPE